MRLKLVLMASFVSAIVGSGANRHHPGKVFLAQSTLAPDLLIASTFAAGGRCRRSISCIEHLAGARRKHY